MAGVQYLPRAALVLMLDDVAMPCQEVDISQWLLELVMLFLYGWGGRKKFEFKREQNVPVGRFFWWLNATRLRPKESIVFLCSALFHTGERLCTLFYGNILLQYMTDCMWAVVVLVTLDVPSCMHFYFIFSGWEMLFFLGGLPFLCRVLFFSKKLARYSTQVKFGTLFVPLFSSPKLIWWANEWTQVPHLQIAMVWDLHLHPRSLGADFVVWVCKSWPFCLGWCRLSTNKVANLLKSQNTQPQKYTTIKMNRHHPTLQWLALSHHGKGSGAPNSWHGRFL